MQFFAAIRTSASVWMKTAPLAIISAVMALLLPGCAVTLIGTDPLISNSKVCQSAAWRLGYFVDGSQTVDFDQDHIPDCLIADDRSGREFLFAWNGRLRTMTDLGPMGDSNQWGYGTQGVGVPQNGLYPTLITAGGRNTVEFFTWEGNGLRRVLYIHDTTGKVSWTEHGTDWPIVKVRYPDHVTEYQWNGLRYVEHSVGE